MSAFARLVYVVERGKKTVIAMREQEAQEKRRKLAQQTSLTASAQVPVPTMKPDRHGQEALMSWAAVNLLAWCRKS